MTAEPRENSSLPFLLDQVPADWTLPDAANFRRQQLGEWVFLKRARTFGEMSNLPASFRTDLERLYQLQPLTLTRMQGSEDSTRKFLFRLSRGDYIESVLIPASPALYGTRSDRYTLCVSSQVGCAYGCKFCASGLDGWKRNLSAGEIVAQIMEAEYHGKHRVNNLVFMGMGEPLANFDNLMKAVEMINAPWGLNIGARHITISTSGLAPRIRELAELPMQLRLAISLHGATNEVRNRIMPVNKKHPLEDLLAACAAFQQRKNKIITFEYILIDGVNDSLEQASLLAGHARRLHAKINLIPYNTVEGLDWKRPPDSTIKQFAAIVKRAGASATVRLEKGHDIDAACGQLRLKELRSSV